MQSFVKKQIFVCIFFFEANLILNDVVEASINGYLSGLFEELY
jgi:hypothetical protein